MKTFNESFEDINRLCKTEHKPLLAMLGKLMEETGEAAECVLIHEGQITHKTMKEPLVGEIADVIQVAISILVKSTPDLSMEERQHLLLSHLERKNLKWESVQQGEESRQCAQVAQQITKNATGDHGRPLAPAGNIEQQIIKIIAEHFDLSKRSITLEAHLVDDLGADSLDTIEICMAIEDEFDMEISDADAERCLTVEKIINYVKGRYGFEDEADDVDDGTINLEAYSAPADRSAGDRREDFDPAAEYTEQSGRHLSLNERMQERSLYQGRGCGINKF